MEKFNKTMKIIISVIYVLTTISGFYIMFNAYNEALTDESWYGLGVAVIIIVWGIVFVILSVISLILLIIGLFRKDPVKFYVLSFFIPIITEILLIVLGLITNNHINSIRS